MNGEIKKIVRAVGGSFLFRTDIPIKYSGGLKKLGIF